MDTFKSHFNKLISQFQHLDVHPNLKLTQIVFDKTPKNTLGYCTSYHLQYDPPIITFNNKIKNEFPEFALYFILEHEFIHALQWATGRQMAHDKFFKEIAQQLNNDTKVTHLTCNKFNISQDELNYILSLTGIQKQLTIQHIHTKEIITISKNLWSRMHHTPRINKFGTVFNHETCIIIND